MNALSLTQPWATLFALGCKTTETRSRPPGRRLATGDLVAIHATLTVASYWMVGPTIEGVLAEHIGRDWRNEVPTGAVVAIGRFLTSGLVVELRPDVAMIAEPGAPDDSLRAVKRDAFGDFSVGRHLWVFEDVKAIDPIPARGFPWIWSWDAPHGLVDAAE